MLTLASEAGIKEVRRVSAATLGLRPPNNLEELLVATTRW